MALNALNTATAGLKVTQAQIGIVSQNVANAGTVGYVRRTLTPVTLGPGNAGVASGTIARTLDAAALQQMRAETAGAAYTNLTARVRAQVDTLFGAPGDTTALDGVLNTFARSLQTLAGDPSSAAARAQVVSGAASLAGRIGTTADGIQSLRSAMETQIADDTAQASRLLTTVADLNTRIAATADDAGLADLQDQRDQAINTLSALIDVRTVGQDDGTVILLTGSGVTLVEHGNAATLSFDSRAPLSPNALSAADPAQRGVGTLVAKTPGGAMIDLVATRALRSGAIAAALELRDGTLPQAQRQLDDLAAGLARAMSDRLAVGAPATDGTHAGFDLDLTGLSAGNAITLTVQDAAGVQRNLILVPSYLTPPAAVSAGATDDAGALVVPVTIPKPSAARDPAALRAALAGALGPAGFSVAATPDGAAESVRILSSGGPTLRAAHASVTQATGATDTRNGSPHLPLFVDGGAGNALFTGSFDAGAQITGFAQRIAVNPAVASNTASLVSLGPGSPAGDATRPRALYDALTATRRSFSSSSGIGGVDAPYADTVIGFAQGVIAAQGAAAAAAQDLDQGQSIALSTAQGRFASQAGVNIDEEMSRLIELQTAYTANARVLSAARDMLDTLLRI